MSPRLVLEHSQLRLRAVMVLTLSDTFMTFAWYRHLKYRDPPRSIFRPTYLGDSFEWNYSVGFACIALGTFFGFHQW